MSHRRGEVWFADIPKVGDKPVVIVSWDVVNSALAAIVARVTSAARERPLPTIVELGAGEVEGLPERSWVVCHDLFTLPKPLRRYAGTLSSTRLAEVDAALRRALDL